MSSTFYSVRLVLFYVFLIVNKSNEKAKTNYVFLHLLTF